MFFIALCGKRTSRKSDFLDIFVQKADFSSKKRTNLEAFLIKGPLSDQGLIKRTYLAALPRIAAAGAAAVLRDPEVLLAGQPDQQPGIHGPQN